MLYLEFGGHRFNARLTGTLNPEDFRVGEFLKVRVAQSEGPIVLEVIESPRGKVETGLLYLFSKGRETNVVDSSLKFKEISILADLLKGLTEKTHSRDRGTSKSLIEDILGEDIKASNLIFEEDRLFLPFVFKDHKSWGFLEVFSPEEKGEKIRIFALKLFLDYLGYLEAFFSYRDNLIEVELWFSEKEVLEYVREYINELKKDLSFSAKFVKIVLEKKEVLPGQLLEKIG